MSCSSRLVGFQAMPDAGVVDEPVADRQVGHDRHAEPVELCGRADPAALEHERRPVRAAGEHDRAGLEVEGAPSRITRAWVTAPPARSTRSATARSRMVRFGRWRASSRYAKPACQRVKAPRTFTGWGPAWNGVEVARRLHERALPGREVDLARRAHPELPLRPREERLDRRVRPVVAPLVVDRRAPDRRAGVVRRAAADHAGAQLRAVVGGSASHECEKASARASQRSAGQPPSTKCP